MKLKTIRYVKVEVLKFGKVNYFVQDHTASINNREGSDLLSEPQTMLFQSHHPKCCIKTAEGAELMADMLWIIVNDTEHSTGSLPGPARARREVRSKMMWLINCG